ncbi:minor capsid protein [Listeria ilorinensis]|uniref:minor capsid protein n=1 Tax=Listeria ilorinensis TaxID=2867439 RepID=UPI001EF5F469|nr:minor capsid protein [Listeria ilorinensis]
MKKENQTLIRIKKQLDKELHQLNQTIKKYYGRYGHSNVFQYEKLLEGLSDSERNELYANTSDFMAKHPNSAFLTDVRNSYYKLQRLDGLKANLAYHLANVAALEEELLPAAFADFYDMGYKRTLYDEAMFYGVERIHSGYDMTALKRTLNTEWTAGGNYSKRIWRNNKKLIETMQNEFVMWISRGDSVDKISRKLASRFQVKYNQSARLVRTEATFFVEQGTLTAYEENGTAEYRFLATLDSKTSKMCQKQDGKVYPLNEAVVGVNYPPLHPHCRSTTVSAASKSKVRTARLGKGYQTIPYMTYPEWQKKYASAA